MKGRVFEEAVLILREEDTVGTALEELSAGRVLRLAEDELQIGESIPFGHKVALTQHEAGSPVYKYGEIIGRATDPIQPGTHVHTHNVESTRGRGDITASHS